MKPHSDAAVAATPAWSVVPYSAATLATHADDWDALLERLQDNHPLRRASMIGQLLAAFGNGTEHLCTARDARGAIVAMLVLQASKRRAWRSFQPPQAPFCPLLFPRGMTIDAIWQALPTRVVQLDLLGVDDRRSGLVTAQRGRPNCTFQGLAMVVELHGGFDGYWNGRADALRQDMQHAGDRLAAKGRVEFRSFDGAAEIGPALQRCNELEQRSNAGHGNGQSGMYSALMPQLAASDGAEVHELWVGGTLAASQLLLVQDQHVVMLKASHDERLSEARPGCLLLQHVLRDGFTRHAGRTVDFRADASRQRLQWATGRAPIFDVRLRRSPDGAGFQFATAARALRRPPQRRTGPDLRTEAWRPDDAPSDVLALLGSAESTNAQYGADWLLNLSRTVKMPGQVPWLHALRDDSGVLAVLPLFVGERHPRSGRRIDALANYYSACYAPALAAGVDAAALARLLADVLRRHPGTASLRLAPMDTTSQAFSVLRDALALAGLVTYPFFCFGNWYQRFDGMSWPSYLASRTGKQRSTIKRMGQRFGSEGGTLEVVTEPQHAARALAAFEQVYSRSWKQPEPHPGFIPGLVEACARRGWLRLGIAWLGEQPIAAQLWIVCQGKADIYKLAYDEAFPRFSIGTLLTAKMLEHVFTHDQAQEVDYLIGDDAYKRDWLDSRRERWGLIAYNPGTLPGAAGAALEAGKRMAKLLLRRQPLRGGAADSRTPAR